MAELVLRTVKGAPLTNLEVDNNFSNINVEIGVLAELSTTAKDNLVAAINEVYGGGFSDVDITGGNIIGLANLASSGNVYGNYFLGNGSLLSGITVDSTRILSGNSAVVIAEEAGNILFNVNATAMFTVTEDGLKDRLGNVLVIKDSSGQIIWGA
jgi:hypothetical protein